MTILLMDALPHRDAWAEALREKLPGHEVRVWPDVGNADEIEHAVACFPELGELAKLPNLKAMHSLWAGIDHVTRDPDMPWSVPLIRMVDHSLTQGMLDYVTGHVYRFHLTMPAFEALQAQAEWHQQVPPLVEERSVGIMGIGVLGSVIAKQLAGLGFQVRGWARTQKTIDGVDCFAGDAGLTDFLAGTEILVLLLPNTPETADIVNDETLAKLPAGATLINAGRGTLIDEGALIQSLDSGHLTAATLDVFKTEPLPKDHPFWAHPKISVTPHVAAETRISTASESIARNIRHLESGGSFDEIDGVVDAKAGY